MDMATLGLRVDAGQSIAVLHDFKQASDAATKSTQQLAAEQRAEAAATQKATAEQRAALQLVEQDRAARENARFAREQASQRAIVQAAKEAQARRENATAIEREAAALEHRAALDRAAQKSGIWGASATDAEAIEGVAKSVDKVEVAAKRAGPSINTVRSSMTAMLASSLQTAPGVAQLGGALSSMAVGSAVTVGVLGAVSLITYAWKKMSEEARTLRTDTLKAVESLREMARQRSLGAAGDTPSEVAAAQARLRVVEQKIRNQQAILARNRAPATKMELFGDAVAIATMGPTSQTMAANRIRANQSLAEYQKEYTELKATVSGGEGQIQRLRADSYSRSLASLITSDQATIAERKRASEIIKQNETEQAYLVAGGSTDDRVMARRAELAGNVDTLTSALRHKTDAQKASIKEETAEIKLMRELEQLTRDVAAATDAEAAAKAARMADSAALIQQRAAESEALLEAARKGEKALQDQQEELDALNELTAAGIMVNDEMYESRLADIRVTQQNTRAILELKKAWDAEAQARKDAIAKAERDREREAEDAKRAAAAPWDEAARGIQKALADAFDQSLLDASKFAENMLSIFRKLAAQIAAAMVSDALGIDKLLKKLKDEGIAGLSRGQRMAAAGLAGLGVGYSIGQQSSGRLQGGVGGAMGGALTGFAIAGPAGAAIGAIAGFASGMIGAGKAAEEASRRLAMARKEFKQSMEELKARASGDSLQQELLSLQKEREEFQRKRILTDPNAAVAVAIFGKAHKVTEAERLINEYFDTLEQRARDAHAVQKAAALRSFDEDLAIRGLEATGRDKEAAALRRQYQQEEELRKATSLGVSAEQIARLKEVHALEDAAAAANRLAKSLANIPDVLPLELYRFRHGGSVTPTPTTTASGTGSTTYVFHGPVDVRSDAPDAAGLFEDIRRVAVRDVRTGGQGFSAAVKAS